MTQNVTSDSAGPRSSKDRWSTLTSNSRTNVRRQGSERTNVRSISPPAGTSRDYRVGRDLRPVSLHGVRQSHSLRRRHHASHLGLSALHGRRRVACRRRTSPRRTGRRRVVSLVWQRRIRRTGDCRGSGLSSDGDVELGLDGEIPLVRRAVARGLLTRALERSLDVARDEEETHPPSALRPLLKFRKLPKSALDSVAMAVHGDDHFRRRLIECVDECDVGRAALIWFRQAPDWREQPSAYLEDVPNRP